MSYTAEGGRTPIGPQLAFCTRLPREPEAPARARAWVVTCLADRIPGAFMSDAMTVVGEFVRFITEHGRGSIEIRLAVDGGCLTGDITDEGAGIDGAPVDQLGDLLLVGALVDRWGVSVDAAHAWFRIGMVG